MIHTRPALSFVLTMSLAASTLVGCTRNAPVVTVTKRTVQKPISSQVDSSPEAVALLTSESDAAVAVENGQVSAGETARQNQNPKASEAMEPAGPYPIAVIEDHVHEFGNMEPHQQREHSFVIRNDGSAPLKIRAGESSCKCTIGKVESEVIPPGGQSNIVLSWHTTTETKLFAHEAEVLTNDPQNPVLVCRVQGTVLQRIEASPKSFTFAGVSPGETSEMTVAITSQVWDHFELSDLSTSLIEITHDVRPMTDQEKADRKAKVGYLVTVKLPSDLPRGSFSDQLRMQLKPAGQSAQFFELPISGRVLRRVSVYGNGINSYGVMNLGRVPVGKGIKKSFIVKIRDEDPRLEVKKMETVPDFVKVRFEQSDYQVPGLYRMDVEVPKDAPSSFYPASQGRLHVEFVNPRFEDLELSVEFAVGVDT